MKLKNKLRGSYFTPTGLVTGTIPTGSSFTLIEVPEVEGIYYRLTSLWSDTTSSAVGGFNFFVDGGQMLDHTILAPQNGSASSTKDGWFMIATCFTGDNATNGSERVYQEILCKSFKLSNFGEGTTQPIVYGYEIGKVTA